MSALEAWHDEFWRSVRHLPAAPELAARVKGTATLDAEARIAIYRQAYWVRQVSALREVFPSLVARLGDGPFARIASQYLAAHPSTSWALEHLGRQLAGYLEAQNEPELAARAALEQARLDALVAPDSEAVRAESLDLARFAESALRVGAHVTAVKVTASMIFELPQALASTFQEGFMLAVWRDGFTVVQRWVTGAEGDALRAARAETSLPTLVESLSDGASDEAGAAKAFGALQGWFSRGWVSALSSKLAVGLVAMVALAGCELGMPGPGPKQCDVPATVGLAEGEMTGPMMRPGSNCVRCHVANGLAKNKPFGFGGTVFPQGDSEACDGVAGVTIRVTDSEGKKVEVVSNEVGNFWSIEPMKPPLMMEAEAQGRVLKMPVTAPTGGCALCHSHPAPVSASGRIRIP